VTSSSPHYDCLAPLVNAKYLTTLKLGKVPTSTTFRQMADNYTCIQHVDFYGCDSSENSDVAYFLEKQSETLTSITLTTPTEKPLIAISKCQNLTKLFLKVFFFFFFEITIIVLHFFRNSFLFLQIWGSKVIDMNALGRLSNLRCLSLECIVNHNLGQSIEAAKLKHLNEIEFKYMNGLHDNDVSRIAQFYGPQVMKCGY
jgi:hypothetical protein